MNRNKLSENFEGWGRKRKFDNKNYVYTYEGNLVMNEFDG